MKSIEQKIFEDIAYPTGIDPLVIVEYRKACKFDQIWLNGYTFLEGDYHVSDGFGTCVYRPCRDDFYPVWIGGEWRDAWS